MKMRPLGTPARPVVLGDLPATAPAPAPAPVDPVGYAVVSERDKDGVPTRIGLPGPLAARQVPLFVHGPRGRFWAGAVIDDGRITFDFKNGAGPEKSDLARIRPGTRIIAATGPDGRVIALTAAPTRTK
jgi:hypothetical protein